MTIPSLRLDPKINISAAVTSILEKANKGHSLALAVSYSLRYDKHHSNPAFCSSLVEMLNLWKSCVLPHFLLYLRYISAASQVQTLQATLNRSLSTTLHVYGHPTALLADTGFPPLYITQNLQLAQFRFRLHCTLFSTFYGTCGSPVYKWCNWTHLKTASNGTTCRPHADCNLSCRFRSA